MKVDIEDVFWDSLLPFSVSISLSSPLFMIYGSLLCETLDILGSGIDVGLLLFLSIGLLYE